jgi:uncharacterized membrane protein affecting hemolysin expression
MAAPVHLKASSDRWRVALLGVLTMLVALMVASTLLILNDQRVYSAQKLREVTVQAQLVAASTAASLVFEDPEATQEYLSSVAVNPEIEAAAVYDGTGRAVATFTRAEVAILPGSLDQADRDFGGQRLTVTQPVLSSGKQVGAVRLRVVTEPFTARLARYAGIIAAVLMGSLLLGVLVTAYTAVSRTNRQLDQRANELTGANERLRVEMDERRKAEEALRQSQKMETIGQLAAGIAHDFNNMLAIVIGNLSVLKRRLSQGSTDVERYVGSAFEGAQRAATMTQRLLAFSRQQPLRRSRSRPCWPGACGAFRPTRMSWKAPCSISPSTAGTPCRTAASSPSKQAMPISTSAIGRSIPTSLRVSMS